MGVLGFIATLGGLVANTPLAQLPERERGKLTATLNAICHRDT